MALAPGGQILISVIDMTIAGNTRVLLICNSSLAFPVMQELVFFQQLAAVAVQSGRSEITEHVQALLKDTGVPVVELDKKSFAEKISVAIKHYEVNLCLVIGFRYLIPSAVYNLPAKGFFNVHPGPLPAYRGVDPVFWQIVNREKLAGISIHKLDEGYDTGPLVLTQMIKTVTSDTYGMLSSKLASLAAGMTRVLLKLATYDLKIPLKPQPDSTVYYARQGEKEVTINWQQMSAESIIALINACNPWNKGAVTRYGNRIIRILEAEKCLNPGAGTKTPGSISIDEDKSILVTTINNETLKLLIVYVDEGFLNASRLLETGLSSGSSFV